MRHRYVFWHRSVLAINEVCTKEPRTYFCGSHGGSLKVQVRNSGNGVSQKYSLIVVSGQKLIALCSFDKL